MPFPVAVFVTCCALVALVLQMRNTLQRYKIEQRYHEEQTLLWCNILDATSVTTFSPDRVVELLDTYAPDVPPDWSSPERWQYVCLCEYISRGGILNPGTLDLYESYREEMGAFIRSKFDKARFYRERESKRKDAATPANTGVTRDVTPNVTDVTHNKQAVTSAQQRNVTESKAVTFEFENVNYNP